jgi:hypothetical protein
MIIVTNKAANPVTCAAKVFEPGDNDFRDPDLSPAKLAQISNHPSLKWVKVEDRLVETVESVKAKKETK